MHSLHRIYELFSLLVFVEDVSRDSAKVVGGKGDMEPFREVVSLVSGKPCLPDSLELGFCLHVSIM
jgi:hypothetical protein